MNLKLSPTAALLIIGNEILSGQTADLNIHYLAQKLNENGIAVRECRVIPDLEEEIITTLKALCSKYTYVFTTGGIGPTHDDITSKAVANSFNKPLYRHPDIVKKFLDQDPHMDVQNDLRLRMAEIPEGAQLLLSHNSIAPGFVIENIYVLAGVPNIMQSMFQSTLPFLEKGKIPYISSLFCYVSENKIAKKLMDIQQEHLTLEIGSYPSWRPEDKKGVKLVFKGLDEQEVEEAFHKMIDYMQDMKFSFLKDNP